jgi:hypothetical protein
MLRYIVVSAGSGILFGAMDGLLNANPLAQRLYEVFQPIARRTLNMPAALAIDLVYGFALAGIFLLLFNSLPGQSVVKGLIFGLLVWFLRVVMQVVTQWMMFSIPASTLGYTLAVGLVEMLVLGLLYGLILKPAM